MAAVFGGLLMHADPAFDRLVSRALGIDLVSLVSHLATVVLWAWLSAGVLRLVCRTDEERAAAVAPRGALGLGEVGTVLVVVDLLFAAFVLVQFRYLFGGNDLVRELTGMSYAEYARRGFFELVAVAALSLPLLLAADHWIDHRDPARVRRVRQLSGVMLLFLDVMLASALLRMWLYTTQFGLTELRFYTTAFMGWLVVVFGWFVATVLRGRRERFGTGALVGGVAGARRAQPREPGRGHRRGQSRPRGSRAAAGCGLRGDAERGRATHLPPGASAARHQRGVRRGGPARGPVAGRADDCGAVDDRAGPRPARADRLRDRAPYVSLSSM